MAIKYGNNVKAVLAAAINSSVTTLTVVDASSFPTLGSGDVMYLTLSDNLNSVNEIVKCTDVTGTTLTIVRAQEGTTALSWVISSHLQLRITAGLINDLLAENTASEGAVFDPIGASVAMSIALGG
jgi:hypothetical protein|tara:strand:- start:645 stop:1022 length:378 start_codon:yes stop_codon:yes gene_type:complete